MSPRHGTEDDLIAQLVSDRLYVVDQLGMEGAVHRHGHTQVLTAPTGEQARSAVSSITEALSGLEDTDSGLRIRTGGLPEDHRDERFGNPGRGRHVLHRRRPRGVLARARQAGGGFLRCAVRRHLWLTTCARAPPG